MVRAISVANTGTAAVARVAAIWVSSMLERDQITGSTNAIFRNVEAKELSSVFYRAYMY